VENLPRPTDLAGIFLLVGPARLWYGRKYAAGHSECVGTWAYWGRAAWIRHFRIRPTSCGICPLWNYSFFRHNLALTFWVHWARRASATDHGVDCRCRSV